jgi:hypothetical protein
MTFINKYSIPFENGLKQSDDYSYNSSTKQIVINDIDFKTVVSIYNVTVNKTLYILGDEGYSGSTTTNEVSYTNTVSNVSDGDTLYILYKPKETSNVSNDIASIKQQLKKLNKITNKIYQ